ncbi:hypothetical protein ISN39_07415 [Rhizobium sp. 007]|nr:hypothetical protein AJ87_24745 [Rhizobium yanglingense]QPB21268.1 hypothetical protein ISN39_07415 [Rhizobium sp. 007]
MIEIQGSQHANGRPEHPLNCRTEVEAAMFEMIKRLQQHGWTPAEVALALADAAEDYVMLLASKKAGSH